MLSSEVEIGVVDWVVDWSLSAGLKVWRASLFLGLRFWLRDVKMQTRVPGRNQRVVYQLSR